jgi:hypothetical protein
VVLLVLVLAAGTLLTGIRKFKEAAALEAVAEEVGAAPNDNEPSAAGRLVELLTAGVLGVANGSAAAALLACEDLTEVLADGGGGNRRPPPPPAPPPSRFAVVVLFDVLLLVPSLAFI